MSKLIEALFTDPRIPDIRGVVGLKKDKVPYALLPVRMETRFMRVQKEFAAVPKNFEAAVEAMTHLQIQYTNVANDVSGARISGLITETLDLAVALAALTFSTQEQDRLKAMVPTVNRGLTAIFTKAGSDLKQLTLALDGAYGKLVAVINGTEKMAGKTVTGVADNSRNQLWVRIFPDDIFVKTHEPALTAGEQASGKTFWKFWWAASGGKELEKAAWTTLCTACGSKRASWIARELNPNKLDSAKNSAAFANKPSAAIVTATAAMNAALDILKDFPVNTAPTDFFINLIRSNDPFSPVEKIHIPVIKILTGLRTEQDYLLDVFRTMLLKTVSVAQAFLGKSQGLTADQKVSFKVQIEAINKFAGTVATLKNLLDAIKPVEYTAFTNALPEPFDYPAVAPKERDWNVAPHTDCLPTRFVVLGIKVDSFSTDPYEVRYIAIGNPVAPKLQLGLDPAKFNNASAFQIDSKGNLVVEEDIRWMTDYDDAVKKGMAVTVEITEKDFKEGFDHLVVLGIRDADATASKTLLQNLFTNHIYSADGLSFLKVGTPTNNTQHKKSFLEQNSDVDQRYDIEILGKTFNPAETNPLLAADGKVLTDALGLDPSVFQHANNGTNLEIANGLVMNRALWHAGPGHFMEAMGDTLFTHDNIHRAEEFFTKYCLGRGMLPSLQIGQQPYGVLVTTAFSALQLYKNTPPLTYTEMLSYDAAAPAQPPALEAKLQQRFEMRLHEVLKWLSSVIWKSLTAQVVHSSSFFGGDQQQKFMRMLGLHATSLEYFYRYSQNASAISGSDMGGSGGPFNAGDIFGPEGLYGQFKNLMSSGVFYPSFNFIDERPEFAAGKIPSQIQQARISRIFDQFLESRIFRGRLTNVTHPITGNIIDNAPLSEQDSVSKIPNSIFTYFDWLLMSNLLDLYGDNDTANPAKMPSHSLLFLLLRQSLLQAHQEAAANILHKEGLLSETLRRKVGNGDFFYYQFGATPFFGIHPYSVTKWALLFEGVSDLNKSIVFPTKMDANPFYKFLNDGVGVKTMYNYLDSVRFPENWSKDLFKPSHKADFDKVVKVREAIEMLKRVPAADLETLLAEQMDMSTYRLDAWLLGLVNQRLLKQRSGQSSGIFLGAYGYVQNLRPAKKAPLADTTKLAPFNLEPTKPVYHDSDSQGFIHAPSINHAISAAVLRSAYQANKIQEGLRNRLAVNLSSARVRMALNLMEGIRNGQELGALLGFQFERGLHERYQSVELDKFIQPFRKAFPLSQPVEASSNGAGGYVSQVVNGQELLKVIYDAIQWLASATADTLADLLKGNNYAALPQKIAAVINGAMQTGDDKVKIYNAIIEEIDRMADAFDALGDLALSESVYQVVQGNHVRASAVLSALAQGKNIPDPQIIQTPRTGTVVTHRVLLNLPTVADSFTVPAGWSSRGSYRSFTEPAFNNWLGTVTGPAGSIKYLVNVTDKTDTVRKETFSLQDLGWQPIDLYAVPGGEAEWIEIIRNLHIAKNGLFDATVTIDLKGRGADWNATDKTVPEVLLLLTQVRNMLSNARAAGASELLVPDAETDEKNPGGHDLAEFDKRIKAAFKTVQALNAAIGSETFVAPVLDGTVAAADVVPKEGDLQKIMDHLTNAVMMGIPNALSLSFDPEADSQQRFTAALQHLLNVYKQCGEREAAAAEIIAVIDGSDDTVQKIEKLGELAKTIFGKTFTAIPLYQPANATAIAAQLTLPEAQRLTRNEGPTAVETWLQSLAKVRKRMFDTAMTRQLQDVANASVTTIQPVQLPYAAGDYWLGIEYPAAYKPGGDKLSLVLLNEGVFATQRAQAGLIVDEWHEIIPAKEETSGIVFHYNQPNATAPQSILLAVSPDYDSEWLWDDLVQTVMDTVELAKIRAVEPEHVDTSDWNHVLPAVLSEVGATDNPLSVKAVMDFSNVDKLKN